MGKAKRFRGRPYTIYPKKTKNGPVFYAEFRGPDGKFGSGKCTHQRTRGAAETWALEYLKKGQVLTSESVTFEAFAMDFFNPKKPYAKNRIARGYHLSERRLAEQGADLVNHLLPAFGKKRLVSIDYKTIATFQTGLLAKGRAGDTVNGASAVLKVILQEAFNEKLIQDIPLIERVATNSSARGTLSTEEVKTLFIVPWENFNKPILNEYRLEARTGNLLAATTGLRQGEIVALKRSSVQSAYISVEASWDNIYHRLKAPKTEKSTRFVPIPGKVYEALAEVMEGSIWKESDDFLFQGERQDRPMNPEILRDSLYEMLGKVEIDEAERSRRNITFHSWRHWFNSLLVNSNISKFKIQALTGHVTDAMTQRYYHADKFQDVLALQESLFLEGGVK